MSDTLQFEDFELAPIPANETPREFLLRMTGNDFSYLEGFSWNELKEAGMMRIINHMIDISTHPPILMTRKRSR